MRQLAKDENRQFTITENALNLTKKEPKANG